eukprot:Skav215042  [mRNA]  locus=scaffold2053:10359:10730:+ [translate_table: standard]
MRWLDLHVAAYQGDIDVLQKALRARVDVNATDENLRTGRTALMKAAQNGRTNSIRLLLEARADVHAAANDGETALITAIRHGKNEDCARLLVEAGSDVNAANDTGKTALDYAECLGTVKQWPC